MSRSPNHRPPNERRLMDEFQRCFKVPDSELVDELDDDDDSRALDDLVRRLRDEHDPVTATLPTPPTMPSEPWHERLLRGLIAFMAGMLLFGLLAGCLALVALPLLEDVTEQVACETLVWYAHRRSLAYALIAFCGSILGVSLLVALPALGGREHRSLRLRLAPVAAVVLAVAVASGEKERVLRAMLGSLPSTMTSGKDAHDPTANRRCMEPIESYEIPAL